MKRIKQKISIFLILILSFCFSANAFAYDAQSMQKNIENSSKYILQQVKEPFVGSIGGEWTVIALAGSEAVLPEGYMEEYYENVELTLKDVKGVLHERKYTEYSRVALAVATIGKDPSDVGGYNLLMPLADYENVVYQGVNGAIWALIALDSGSYAVPENKNAIVQASRQMYVDEILSMQLPDGGWNLSGSGTADVDVTAMALQALAGYKQQEKVSSAVSKGLDCLSKLQNYDGGYTNFGQSNSESISQVIIALSELGISTDDARFVKGANTLVDALLKFKKYDGSFSHVKNGESNLMATEQALCALASAKRFEEGKKSLYKINAGEGIKETKGVSIKEMIFSFLKVKGY